MMTESLSPTLNVLTAYVEGVTIRVLKLTP